MITREDEIMEASKTIESIARLYLFLGRCFSYPEEGFCESMRDERLTIEIKGLVKGLPFEMDFKGIPPPSLVQVEFESAHINFFDISGNRPLYETAYTAYRDDMSSRDIYDDLLLFYEHFDIKLSEMERDYPDHLVTELEFMAFLVKKEADALEHQKDPAPYRRAQMDFLERHLNRWVHKLDERMERVKEPFYKGASAFMVELISNHQAHLRDVLKS